MLSLIVDFVTVTVEMTVATVRKTRLTGKAGDTRIDGDNDFMAFVNRRENELGRAEGFALDIQRVPLNLQGILEGSFDPGLPRWLFFLHRTESLPAAAQKGNH